MTLSDLLLYIRKKTIWSRGFLPFWRGIKLNNIISLVLLELKFILKSTFIWVGISVAFFYSVAIFLKFELTNKSADPNSFYSFFNDISFYVLAFFASVHLSKEFDLSVSRLI